MNNVVTDQNPGRPFRMSMTAGDSQKGEPDIYTFRDQAGKEVPAVEVIKDTPLIVKGDSLKPTSKAEINPNTGEPLVTSTGYIGVDVQRASRIGSAAHGGQVLLSQATRELAEGSISVLRCVVQYQPNATAPWTPRLYQSL